MPQPISLGADFTEGSIPDSKAAEEVKEGEVISPEGGEGISQEEKVTPSELPAEEKPALEPDELPSGDASEYQNQIKGLQSEREKLLTQIRDLRGQRREIKQDELAQTEKKLDELKDLHPDDVSVIERVLRAKGYTTREDANKMLYDAVKQEELNKFLEKYPEYKTDNDRDDINWNSLQRELGYYKMPANARQIGEILEKAHRTVSKTPSDLGTETKRRQLQTASAGGGGISRSSSKGASLDPFKRDILLRGGWSEEEIKKMESKLEE